MKKSRIWALAALAAMLATWGVPTLNAQSTDTPNIVKLNPLAIANGYFPIAYERVLFSRLGVEVGAGPTYRDFLYHFIYDAATDDKKHGEFHTASGGLGVYGALRLYVSKEKSAPEGMFLAAQFQYRSHEWDQNYTGEFNPLLEEFVISKKNSRHISDLAVLLGWQAPIATNFLAEFSFGVGLRYRSIDRVKVVRNTAGYDEFRDDKPGNTTIAIPVNLKIGYAF